MHNLSRDELINEILKVTDEHGFNTDVMPGYLYAKVLYLLDDLAPLLSDTEKAKIKRHGVQRGIENLAGRPDPRGIPDECYATYMGNVVIIQKDVSGVLDLGLELDEEEAQAYADSENTKAGVSRAQSCAMLAGATSGWNLHTAYQSYYLKDGTVVSELTVSRAAREYDDYGNEQLIMGGA